MAESRPSTASHPADAYIQDALRDPQQCRSPALSQAGSAGHWQGGPWCFVEGDGEPVLGTAASRGRRRGYVPGDATRDLRGAAVRTPRRRRGAPRERRRERPRAAEQRGLTLPASGTSHREAQRRAAPVRPGRPAQLVFLGCSSSGAPNTRAVATWKKTRSLLLPYCSSIRTLFLFYARPLLESMVSRASSLHPNPCVDIIISLPHLTGAKIILFLSHLFSTPPSFPAPARSFVRLFVLPAFFSLVSFCRVSAGAADEAPPPPTSRRTVRRTPTIESVAVSGGRPWAS